MTKFSDLNIEYTSKGFEGDSISIERLLNQEISVLDFKIEDSKIEKYKNKGAGKCLYLQILHKNEKWVIFTSGSALMEVIQKVPRTCFPFNTTIIKENRTYKFT
jgi:hypothetical protein